MSKLYYILNDEQIQKASKRVKFNKPAKKYFQETKAFFDCFFLQKYHKTKLLRKTLLHYVLEHPDPTESDLIHAFGTPEELANTISAQSYSDKLWYKRLRWLFSVLFVCCFLIVASRCIYLQHNRNKFVAEYEDGYGVLISYSSKKDVEQLPDGDKYSIKYGLDYNYTINGTILDAFDSETGEPVDIDSSGKPLDPEYPLSEEYQSLPDK